MNNSYITIIKEKRTVLSRKRVPLNQNECTADFRIGVPFEQNLQVNLVNMYSNYKIRTELLKNRQFYNNVFQTAVNYDELMSLKKELKK